MTTLATTQKWEARSWRRSVVLLSLALGAALSATVALAGAAPEAKAAFTEKIVFASNRTTGTGVDNPTGDYEIFRMNPDGTGVRQLTANAVEDSYPVLSPDGTKIAYGSLGNPRSNPEGDFEVYRMNASDGTGKKNLSDSGAGIGDRFPVFSPDGTKIAYASTGVQDSNSEGDTEVYTMNATDGSGKKNLSNNGAEVYDFDPVYSPGGGKIAYQSGGAQDSNPEGDDEVYTMNATDGSGKKNLSNNGVEVYDYEPDYSPGGGKIAYMSDGTQDSNPEGDVEVYRMNASDGSAKTNLSNNGTGVKDRFPDFSPDGTKIAYYSDGAQDSNTQGDMEIYTMNASDGKRKKNLTDNGAGINDVFPTFSPGGGKIAYTSGGAQDSNPEGDGEVYRVNALDGTGKKNLTNNGAADNSPDWGVQGT